MLAGARHPHVQQSPLLLDRGGSLGQGDRQQALTDAHEQDGIPLQALGGVQGGQGDTLNRRRVLGGGALTELGDQPVQVGAALGTELIGQLDDGVQGVPPFTHGTAGSRGLLTPALTPQHHPGIGADIAGEVCPLGAGGGAQHDNGAFDLVPLEEALTAAHQVADTGIGQGPLDRLGLGVGAVQDGDLTERHTAGAQPADLLDHTRGLGDIVLIVLEVHGGPAGALRDELNGASGKHQRPAPAARARQHPVGQRHDLRGGAVVAAQSDRAGAGVAGCETSQEVGGGAGEGVDRLGDVPDDAQLAAPPQPQVQEALLERGDVLVLIDHEVLVLAAHLISDVLAVQEDADHQEQDVLEIDDSALGLGLLVGRQHLGNSGEFQASGGIATQGGGLLDVILGQGHGDLRPLNLGRQVADEGAVGGQAEAVGGGADEAALELLDLGAATADRRGPEVCQLTQSGGVEGARLGADHTQIGQARAHLSGGTGREGDGQDLGGLVGADGDSMSDAVGDGPGLSRSRTREDAQGPFKVLGDLALVGVQGIEQRGGAGQGSFTGLRPSLGGGALGVVTHHGSACHVPPTCTDAC